MVKSPSQHISFGTSKQGIPVYSPSQNLTSHDFYTYSKENGPEPAIPSNEFLTFANKEGPEGPLAEQWHLKRPNGPDIQRNGVVGGQLHS